LMQQLLQKQLGEGPGYQAVRNAVVKYIDAYNTGLLKIHNPIMDVAMLLYYKIGLENTAQKVVDETYYVPEPQLVEMLIKALTMFLGKWEILLERYELATPPTIAPDDNEAQPRGL
jgi:hypothetical protein